MLSNTGRNLLVAFAFGLVLLSSYQAWRWYSTPPALQASSEAKKSLDGLFTALTARDEAKLATCMDRIEVHFAEGKLSEKAVFEARNCCKMAKAESWEKAAKRLYWMIFEQTQ